jgi:acyl carrier protein
MSREEVERRVVEIIAANLGIDADNVRFAFSSKDLLASSYKELGADSLDLYSIMMDIEEALGVMVPDRDAQRLGTVSDTVEYVLANCRGLGRKAGGYRS